MLSIVLPLILCNLCILAGQCYAVCIVIIIFHKIVHIVLQSSLDSADNPLGERPENVRVSQGGTVPNRGLLIEDEGSGDGHVTTDSIG